MHYRIYWNGTELFVSQLTSKKLTSPVLLLISLAMSGLTLTATLKLSPLAASFRPEEDLTAMVLASYMYKIASSPAPKIVWGGGARSVQNLLRFMLCQHSTNWSTTVVGSVWCFTCLHILPMATMTRRDWHFFLVNLIFILPQIFPMRTIIYYESIALSCIALSCLKLGYTVLLKLKIQTSANCQQHVFCGCKVAIAYICMIGQN